MRDRIVMSGALALGLIGCSAASRLADRPAEVTLSPAEVTLITSTAVMACDFAQTVHVAAEGGSYYDQNPLLRGHGTAYTVAYGVGSLLLNAAVWYLLPHRWRAAYGGVVTGWESAVVVNNAGITGGRWCW